MITALPLPLPDDEPPAGPNLELDARFGEMERAAQGKAESQYGKVIEAAVEPDWKETARLALALSERSRDLRILGRLAMAELHVTGLPGFAAVVRTMREQLETAWLAVHPQLDPEDDNDPMQRANALRLLLDPARVLKPMRDLPLAATRTEKVSWRDISILTGGQEPEPGRERMTEAKVRGIFAATNRDGLARVSEAVDALLQDLPGITSAFDAAAGGGGPDFADLLKLTKDIRRDLTRYEPPALENPAGDGTEAATSDGAGLEGDEAPQAAPAGRVVRSAPFKSIAVLTTREDAMHALDLASSFFRANEPSSPLPLLIDRAVRLASLPFMDILRDLAPDGLQQAQIIVGPPRDA